MSAWSCVSFSEWIRPGRSTTDNWGLLGPDISMFRTSLEKALPEELRIVDLAELINRGSVRVLIRWDFGDRFAIDDLRSTISVANQVQRFYLHVNGASATGLIFALFVQQVVARQRNRRYHRPSTFQFRSRVDVVHASIIRDPEGATISTGTWEALVYRFRPRPPHRALASIGTPRSGVVASSL